MNHPKNLLRLLLPCWFACTLFTETVLAVPSISVNFHVTDTDAHTVDSNETATAIFTGNNWNNLRTASTANRAPDAAFLGQTFSLLDEVGVAGASLTIFPENGYTAAANATTGGQASLSGESGLMGSFLNFGGTQSNEALTISGLGPAFTGPGYTVYIYFDIGNTTRIYGHTVDDGLRAQTYYTEDTPVDSDVNDDGAMEWVTATGITDTDPTPDANVAIFHDFTGSSFTITGESPSARSIICGFQIVANPPVPVITHFTANPENTTAGTTVTLSWDVADFTHLSIAPNLSAISGSPVSITVNPTATTRYTLTATNENGASHAAAQVTVDGLPLPPSINEFMASNKDTLLDGDGQSSDWIELFNPNTYPLDVGGYYLTDSTNDFQKWVLPVNTEIPARGYLIVFASGQAAADYTDAAGHIHTTFKLSSSGETLALVAPDGTSVVQEFTPAYPPQETDFSYSVAGYHSIPTPGSANEPTTFAGIVADTKFQPDRGYYTNAIAVTITTATPGAAIFFTTNGTPPSAENGNLYAGPIGVSTTMVVRAAAFFQDFRPTDSDSHTYLFAEQIGSQGNAPTGYPTSWGTGAPADYEMDSDVVHATAQSPALLIESLKTLPAFSIALDPDDMFGSSEGIYANPTREGIAWERAASAELIFPDASRDGFAINCGVRIQGKSSRSSVTGKRSMSLRFRSAYGEGKLRFPVFEDDPLGADAIDRFDYLQLRAVSNYSFTHWHYYQGANAHPNRDGFCRDLYRTMGHHGTHGRWIHLYINGLYWGVYNLHERADANHLSNYFGGEPEDYDAIKENRAIDGSTASWTALRNIVDSSDINTTSRYAEVSNYLDVDAFIDYVLLNFYVGNRDWGGQNWMAARLRAPGAHFHHLIWDSEFAMSPNNNASAAMSQALSADITGYNFSPAPNHVHQRLALNAAYRLNFADRVYQHCFGDGVLTPTKTSALWQLRANVLDLALVAESARWGDYRRDVNPTTLGHQSSDFDLYTRDNTIRPVNDYLVGTYFPARRDVVVAQLRTKTLYPSIDPPVFPLSGGPTTNAIPLINPNGSGDIYYTTDGRDPTEAAAATLYSGPINLATSGPVKTRIRISGSGEWSALSEERYIVGVPAIAGKLVISEIHYNPLGSAETNEFIEIMNISPGPLDLTGVRFTAGIAYTFPDNTTLAPGDWITLHAGTYTNQLDNDGEPITLVDNNGLVIESFRFFDSYPWPERPDGNGPSLVRIAPQMNLAPSLATSWRSSTTDQGNPNGIDALPTFSGNPSDDLNANGSPDLLDHATGGNPPHFDDGTFNYFIQIGADDVWLDIEYSSDLSTWQSAETHLEWVGESITNGILQRSFGLTGTRKYLRLRATQR